MKISHAHQRGQHHQEDVERVYVAGHRSRPGRPKWKVIEHSQSSVVRPRSLASRYARLPDSMRNMHRPETFPEPKSLRHPPAAELRLTIAPYFPVCGS